MTVFVDEKHCTTVSDPNGRVYVPSKWPPHRSTTGSPSTKIATAAPMSWPVSRLSRNAARTGSNRPTQVPATSTLAATAVTFSMPFMDVSLLPQGIWTCSTRVTVLRSAT